MKKKNFEVATMVNGMTVNRTIYTDFVKAYAHAKRLVTYGFRVQFVIKSWYPYRTNEIQTDKRYFFENGKIEHYTSSSSIKFVLGKKGYYTIANANFKSGFIR